MGDEPENNILWVDAGYDISVDPDSQVGFSSDYNLLYATETGVLARWADRDFDSLTNWRFEVGLDQHSRTADPLFIDPGGPDGVLGYDSATRVDYGLDDDFRVQSTSPTVDAGHPNDDYLSEAVPNGGRVHLGHTGNTAAATTSPAQLVQVLSPNGLEKLERGQSVTIQWRSAGLTETHPVGLINAGFDGAAIDNWQANRYQTVSSSGYPFTDQVDVSGVSNGLPSRYTSPMRRPAAASARASLTSCRYPTGPTRCGCISSSMTLCVSVNGSSTSTCKALSPGGLRYLRNHRSPLQGAHAKLHCGFHGELGHLVGTGQQDELPGDSLGH